MIENIHEIIDVVKLLDNNGYKDYQVLLKVPEYLSYNMPLSGDDVAIAIIDLETTGLNYKKDKITEIGIVKIAYNLRDYTTSTLNVYQEFNDPGVEIIPQITELTGITNEMVKGKAIDWPYVEKVVKKCSVVVCHNAAFDRKFLEQTPIGNVFKDKVFACTKNDINWSARGYGANKLDYLNWKLGYWYDAHRAINDCWATLNLLVQEEGALDELLGNSTEQHEVYAIGAQYNAKDTLKGAGFWWNTGDNYQPKAWFKTAKTKAELIEIQEFLDKNVQCTTYQRVIPANRKYSSEV